MAMMVMTYGYHPDTYRSIVTHDPFKSIMVDDIYHDHNFIMSIVYMFCSTIIVDIGVLVVHAYKNYGM